MTKSLTNKLNKCRNKLTEVIDERDELQKRISLLNESIFSLRQELNGQVTGTKRRKSKRKKKKRSKRR